MEWIETWGFRIGRGALTAQDQAALLQPLRDVLRAAPLVRPVTPRGQPMSVRMSAAGRFGWISDRQGYRYAETHPGGAPWPPIPAQVMDLWARFCPEARAPECCLINFYDPDARMGLHQDRDEADFSQPVLSISLGDEARFRMGGQTRRDPTGSVWLQSGDVVVMGGSARLAFHGVDRIRAGSSRLLPAGGRINLTLRVVT